MHDKVERYAPFAGAGFLILVGLVLGLNGNGWDLAAGVVLFALLSFFMLKYIIKRRQSNKKGSGFTPTEPRRRAKGSDAPPSTSGGKNGRQDSAKGKGMPK